jgi:hypothetical protein
MTIRPLKSVSVIVPPPFVAAENAGAASPSFSFSSIPLAINQGFVGELVGWEPSCFTPSQT